MLRASVSESSGSFSNLSITAARLLLLLIPGYKVREGKGGRRLRRLAVERLTRGLEGK